ncbi:ABC transporter ATP-binding protein [uncultured Finegoldia sp.]|uniref:ABC transporter ATP-binding protein n=1 Tax=uncultured Finegoldia sp. TaxID=328009 RepID=UPI0025F723FA|nr:ATP-binding cassette domain-containing protein [uncultured Finegoldia sp.]MDU1878272.1 ATP-binding cassette domain-containing protein [Finegoldia magna]
MIEIKNLTKKFNTNGEELLVLDNAEMNVNDGDNIIISGENGVGKTTFLKIVGLLDKKYSGDYILDSKSVGDFTEKDMSKYRNEVFGFIFQEYNLIESETTYDNILIPLIYSSKHKRADRKQRIQEISEEFEITEILNKKVKFLSGGERQKVTIARALVNDPSVILMDEPSNTLNLRMKDKLIEYIEVLKRKSKTIVVVSHDKYLTDNLKKQDFAEYELEDGKFHKIGE